MGCGDAKLGGHSEVKHMTDSIPEMIDIVFDLGGETPPASYPFALWTELLRLVPLLAEQKSAGILPLRLTANSDGMLLPKRTRLVLRLPAELADRAIAHLSGQPVEVHGSRMRLGAGKKRTIQPYPTVHAQMVAGASDEVLFMDAIREQLRELGVAGNLICGKRHTLSGGQQAIHGFSLVIYDLKPDASLKLQYAGLGESRKYGCGIFIPYKVISGLSED